MAGIRIEISVIGLLVIGSIHSFTAHSLMPSVRPRQSGIGISDDGGDIVSMKVMSTPNSKW
jgi:hypothetical protein